MKKKILASGMVLLGVVSLSACGKAMEPFKDAKRGQSNTQPADTITMPDGFSNVATKCDHGNRVYVLFHQDKPYGGIAVVASDPTCQGGTP